MTQDYSLGPVFGTTDERPDYPLLRHVVQDLQPTGTALEFGVARGTSLAIIAAHMPVIGWDGFQGLPEPWLEYPKGAFSPNDPDTGWTNEWVPEIPVVANSRLVIGWFADTLPTFDFAAVEPLALVHIDCDLYSSAKTVIDHVGPHLKPGCYVVFDEFFDHDGAPMDECRAWQEFASATGITWRVIGNSERPWAIQITDE